MQKSLIVFVVVLTAALFSGGIALAGDTPKAVTEAFKKLAGDAKVKVVGVSHDKKTFYKGDWEVDDREHEAILDAEGKILFEEAEVGEESVPKIVRQAARKLLGAEATIAYDRIVIHKDGGKETMYDAEGGGKEVTLNEKGELLAEDEDDDDDDDDNDDDE